MSSGAVALIMGVKLLLLLRGGGVSGASLRSLLYDAQWICLCEGASEELQRALASVREQDASVLEGLEQRRRALNAERKLVTNEITKKKKRDSRTMDKSVKNLSSAQLMLCAAKKLVAENKSSSSSSSRPAGCSFALRARLAETACIAGPS